MTTATATSTADQRQDFYDRLKPQHMAPLWEVLTGLLPNEPRSKAAPHRWRYADVRPLLMESGRLLTAKEAERRVLVLENPNFTGMSRATSTMYAGIQLIMPGETAPAHRHTPSALRFVLEGAGAFTAVGGERTTMKRGDFIITPSWAFHDHGNEGTEPCAWLDGLDLPLVAFFEAGFNEHYNDERQSLARPEGDALARFGSNMLPLNPVNRYGLTTPIFNYPYERTREALIAASKGEAPDAHEGVALRFANPIDGGWAMPTMSAWMIYLPKGFETKPIRSTDGIVMALGEGAVSVKVGDKSFDMAERDVAVAPGWMWRSFKAAEDSFIFCFSDRVAQEKLGLYREERSLARLSS